jgi:hypothetical protein
MIAGDKSPSFSVGSSQVSLSSLPRQTDSSGTIAPPRASSSPSHDANDTGPPPSSGNGSSKMVVAHVIVGNTASYSAETWTSDIKLASTSGIDGFALNVGSISDFTDKQVANAYVFVSIESRARANLEIVQLSSSCCSFQLQTILQLRHVRDGVCDSRGRNIHPDLD